MLTGRDLYNKIDEIVEIGYLGFLFGLVGSDFFTDDQKRRLERVGMVFGQKPLVELLYTLIRNRPQEGYTHDKTLNNLLDDVQATGRLPVFTDTQQATLDEAKQGFMAAIDNTKEELKRKIKQEVLTINKQYKQQLAVHRYTNPVAQTDNHAKYRNLLLLGIAGLATGVIQNFTRAFTTQLTNTVNDSVVDAVTAATLFSGQAPSKTIVYKEVINDGSLCQWCKRFYTKKDGSPILYSLEELQANGDNIGKPKNEWKPVLGSTHYRCRCQLHVHQKATE